MVALLHQRVNLGQEWSKVLEEELKKPYMYELAEFLREERLHYQIYPAPQLVFNAFLQTPFDQVKVVIMGQDPYHGPGQAHGLCFSVPKGVQKPPSLRNIFKELQADLKVPEPSHGCLQEWAEQGVLLLNATLTVRQGAAASHHGHGWEQFTDAAVRSLVEQDVVFVLWGRSAQEKVQHLMCEGKNARARILKAPHPSPLSAHNGFLGCRHFSQINALLEQMGKTPIDWGRL
ncbi:MAG: uracil-DNA glycosylase [Verrucomicrobia bacterium]|nr:uracil-DNA glycosylase [Verrucomicrobiota bacterium]